MIRGGGFHILRFIFLLALIASPKLNYAQEQTKEIEFSADRMKYVREYRGGAQRLIGNVKFSHEGIIITCDSAYRFDNNSIEAFEHVVIRQGDSLSIRGKKLTYDGNTKIAKISGDVICIEKDMTLTTDELNYDVKKSFASYYNGGKITSKNNTLTSTHGYYDSPSKLLSFRYKVKLVNPEYTMDCDTLKYNTVSRIAFFHGPTQILSKKNKLFCEKGWYNTVSENCQISKNAKIESMPNILSSDSLYYDRKKGYGKAYSKVVLTDTIQRFILKAELAETFEKEGRSILSKCPLLIQPFKKDSLFLKADSIVTIENRKEIKVDSTRRILDSSIIKIFHKVKFFKEDLQGSADSAVYTYLDSCLTLFKEPIVWTDSAQATAKQIKIVSTNTKIKYMELNGNSFFISQEDSLRFNQLSGKTVKGYFVKDTLRQIEVNGNAKAIYFLKNDKKKFVGVNQTECKDITVRFDSKGKADRVSFLTKPTAKITPISDVDLKAMKLKGFIWLENLKPKSAKEITDCNINR